MTTDRRQQSTNGRVYVEGTLVEAREETERRRRGSGLLVPVILAVIIGALIARRVLRGAAA